MTRPTLMPVTRTSTLLLNDRDARRPAPLRNKDSLKAALEREVKTLGTLQQRLYADRRHALLIILQGRDASGKDGTIRNVFDGCDPQGCRVTSFGVPTPLELSHDFLWRVHLQVPPRGYIGIFNRSHYEDVLAVRVRQLVPAAVWKARYQQINEFERMLTQNGVTILKFFLHISRDEQRERLIDRLDDPEENWKFRAGDLEDRKLWPAYTRAYRDALRLCSTRWAPWYVVPADSKTARNYLVTRTVNSALRRLGLRYPAASREVLALRGTIT
jgi:PPK2 family polyphosphate:nucleotide phosphotransferase